MVSKVLASPVPVIVYVAPSGSRAGSAGFFLLEAADVAAMAPGSNAGAAHPVIEGGAKLDDIMKQKLENDTAAFLRSYVARRGRNVTAAEDAVRASKSYSDQEALQLKLIDLVAPDDTTLLNTIDGRTIARFDGSKVVLHTRDARLVTVEPTLRERSWIGSLTPTWLSWCWSLAHCSSTWSSIPRAPSFPEPWAPFWCCWRSFP